jgi:predicted alpha/beta superfamily hydrolase
MKFYLTILLAFSFSVSAQVNQPTILEHTFKSEAFDTERKISIALPTGYSESDSTTEYIVAYLFDGQFNPYFSMVHSVVDYYSQISEGVPMIVVSIHTTNRSLEFTPKWDHEETVSGWRGNCGSADVLTTSLRNEIIPYIEDNYHTKKYRLGIGHSLGGTYVMQEIFNDKSLFDGIIAVSPNLNYDQEQIVDQGKVFFSKTPSTDPFIYAAAGDQGSMESSFRRSLKKLDSIHTSLISTPSNWECQWLDGDGHMSAFLPTFNYAYLSFSKNWQLSDNQLEKFAKTPETFLTEVENFYSKLSVFVGEKIEPSVDDFNNFGYSLSYFSNYKQSIKVFNEGIRRFPKDPNLHDSKGEVLEEMGEYEAAKKSYQAGLTLLESNPSYYSDDDREYYSEMMSKNVNRLSDDYINYKELIVVAKASFEEKKYSTAAKAFKKAFKLDIIQATHIDRKTGVAAFAQAKKYDAAFEQLELLANKFKLQGRDVFEVDDLMKPLHSDERWEKLMKVMDQNKLNAN